MTKDNAKPMILIVDDDTTNLRFLQNILHEEYAVRLTQSGARALKFLEEDTPDLILLDVEMPQMSGYDLIKIIKQNPKWKDIPIVFLTALEGRDKEQFAFDLGAVDYILKPISVGVVRARVHLHIELERYRRQLEQLVEVRTQQLKTTQDVLLNTMASMTSSRDNETGEHIKRTTIYSQVLLENLMKINHPRYQVEPVYAESIINSAKLHDIGKVSVPDNILLKPGKLTPLEFNVMKQHTVYGAHILDTAMYELGETSYFLSVAREIIISHHEKWDGTGYPYKLEGEDIPLSARIMAIADVYDALISYRPYKAGFSHETAIDIILKDTGTHFDPTLIELSRDVMEGFKEIALKNQDQRTIMYAPLESNL